MAKPFIVLFAVMSLWMNGVQATPLSYSAVFSGLNENPSNASLGSGFARVDYDPIAHSLFVDVDFTGLTGTTTVAHIHCCALPGTNAGVATPTPTFPGFPAGVSAGTYNQLLDLTLTTSFNGNFITASGGTVAEAEAALAVGLANGQVYFNIHTSAFPGGEIRANLAAVPEPATWVLLVLGIAVLHIHARKRRRAAEGLHMRLKYRTVTAG